jgi:hypothetical protein
MQFDLTDEEAEALTTCLRRTIQDDSYPVAPRLGPLKNVLLKLDPMPQQRPPRSPPSGTGPKPKKRPRR